MFRIKETVIPRSKAKRFGYTPKPWVFYYGPYETRQEAYNKATELKKLGNINSNRVSSFKIEEVN